MPDNDPQANQLIAMADALLDGRLRPEDVGKLEQMVCNDSGARQAYLQFVHMTCSLPTHVAAAANLLESAASDVPQSRPADLLSETMVMPALRDMPEPDEPRVITLPTMPAPARSGRVSIRRFQAAAAILLAACLGIALFRGSGGRKPAVSSGVSRASQPAPVPTREPVLLARVTALTAPQSADATSVPLGTEIFAGCTLQFNAGAAELSFANGVVAVVEGPARLTVIDGNTVQLDRGKVCARVPHSAAGFRVASSKLTVTDLGTEFGLNVDPAGLAIAHVFEGRISVALPPQSESAASQVRLLERDQTVRCPVRGGIIEPLAANTSKFTRDISKFARPIPLHSTGAGLHEGDADPHWNYVRNSNDASLRPRPATVAKAYGSYLPNSADSNWISTMRDLLPVPSGTYMFRTTVDLTGLNPATAKIVARVAADDEVRSVRVNGHPLHIEPAGQDARQYKEFRELPITHGFIPGINTIEFDVWNMKEVMALRVEWQGTADAQVVR